MAKKNGKSIQVSAIDWTRLTSIARDPFEFIPISLDSRAVKIKLPSSRLPFGCSVSNFYAKPSYSCDIALDAITLAKLLQLDEEIISRAIANNWLGPGITEAQVRSKYKSPVKFCKPGSNYPPTLKTKIKVDPAEQVPDIQVWTEIKQDPIINSAVLADGRTVYELDSESFDVLQTLVPKGTNASVAVEILGIWFFEGKFGHTPRIRQILLDPPEQAEPDTGFIDDDSDVDFID